MTHQLFDTVQYTVRTLLLILVLWAVAAPRAAAIPWTAVVPPRGLVPRPFPVMQSPFGNTVGPEMFISTAPPEMIFPFPGVGAGGCRLPPIPLPVQPTIAWPARYPSHVVVADDSTRWVECLNARNAARLSHLYEAVGAPVATMGLVPGTSDPCDEASPEPMGWTPGWNLPDPRPAYIIREGHVLITIPDWGGPR